MVKFSTLFLMFISVSLVGKTYATEGMWLPILLEKYNIEQMQQQGFELTAEDIYSVNQACLKDAVVGLVRVNSPFRNFCTGEVISAQGLVLTNHHCAFRTIQQHSSLDNDLLTNGFWAMAPDEELQAQGIGATFLKRMEDVTKQVLDGTERFTDVGLIDSVIQSNIDKIELSVSKETGYLAEVKPLFSGNQYILTLIELYRDIRLVGAPPSAIGKFGGDTDNWMWPRHTGDFALYRIYADSLNKPSEYQPSNRPLTPLKHLEISTKGIKEGDFTMVMGYPGTTTQYLPAVAVQQTTEVLNPLVIEIGGQSLNIIDIAMESDPAVRIQYAAKAAGIANTWKKLIGENRGLKRLNAIEVKRLYEQKFQNWVLGNDTLAKKYGSILPMYDSLYRLIEPYERANNVFWESLMAAELVDFAQKFTPLLSVNKETDTAKLNQTLRNLAIESKKFYKDYHQPTDRLLFEAYVAFYSRELGGTQFNVPALDQIDKKFKGNVAEYTHWVFENSFFADRVKVEQFLEKFKTGDVKKLKTDPIMALLVELAAVYNQNIQPVLAEVYPVINRLDKLYLQAMFEFEPGRSFYPDANSTFRIAYGQVSDYNPRDGVRYHYQTTLKGIIEKDNPEIYDYRVPEKLKHIFASADFGRYADSTGAMPVCFIASNHTTGGNSGSPVLNSKGQLIGLNFDRNWEGTMSDIMYDPNMCRNIMLDIRYVLFIVDKYAGAQRLMNELTIVN